METDFDNIIVLNDEEGNEVRFLFLDLISHEGLQYIVLLPADEEDADEVVILRIDETDDEEDEAYVSVDDEETLNEVFEVFKAKMASEFEEN